MKAYDVLKADIRQIEQNSRGIKKLSERYNSSTGKDENQGKQIIYIFMYIFIAKMRSILFILYA